MDGSDTFWFSTIVNEIQLKVFGNNSLHSGSLHEVIAIA
jgi:hypothetical protein